jgi:RHS repeat-associated protein
MRSLTFGILPVLVAVTPAAFAHNVSPAQGARVTLAYGSSLPITVTPEMGEPCTVTATAVEIVVTTPLLSIQRTTANPNLDVDFSITAARHPENFEETTAVQVSWAATGLTTTGTGDPTCNGSGEVSFNVTVQEQPRLPTIAAIANPATTPTDPVSLATGEFYFEEKPDIMPGGPMPLGFVRYYASRLNSGGSLGTNWSHNFLFTMTFPSSGNISVTDNHGRVLTFHQAGGSITPSSSNFINYQLVSTGSGYALGDPIENRFYNFNSSGVLISIQDRSGNTHTLSYTGGNLTGISDGLGRTLTLAYDSNNHLISVTDGTRTAHYAYTGNNLTSFTDVRGFVTTYAYDSSTGIAGLITKKTLPLGNVATSQVYDSAGRVTSQTDGLGNKTTFAYGSGSTTQKDPRGNSRAYAFDAAGNLTAFTDENGKTTTYAYDSLGRRISVTDSLGNVFKTAYDAASGKVLTYTESDGSVTTYSYITQTQSGITFRDLTGITYSDGSADKFTVDSSGRITAFTDRSGSVTNIALNGHGQATSIANASGGTVTLTYGNDGTVSTVEDASGNKTAIGYDAMGRSNQISHPDGTTRRYTLDLAGNLVSDTDERGKTATFVYDPNGNLTSITDPLGAVTSYGYDADDRLISVTDPNGNKASRSFDSIGNIASRSDRNGNSFTFSYDPASHRTGVTDPAGNAWRRTYDSEGFPLSYADPLNNKWSYSRDSLPRVVKTVNPGGGVTDWNYDKLGRISSVTDAASVVTSVTADPRGLVAAVQQGGDLVTNAFARNSLGEVIQTTDGKGSAWLQGYDAAGRQTTATDPLGQVTAASYDSRNRLATTTFPGNLGNVQLTYDGNGNIVEKRYSDGVDLKYSFDDAGRMVSADGVTLQYDAVGEITSSNGLGIARDAGGRITSVTLAPGKVVNYTYDERDLLVKVSDWAGGSMTFTWDAGSRLVSITRSNGVGTSLSYNNDRYLTALQETGKSAISSITIARDGRGNVTNEDRSVPTSGIPDVIEIPFSYDAASQVSGYTYDAMGRLVSDAGRTYSWDLASRLSSWSDDSGPTAATYDAFGNRISRTRGGVTQNYLLNYAFALQPVSVVRQNCSDVRYYIWSPSGALLYSIEAADNSRRFYHFDESGNTIFLTNDSGSVTDSYAYTPFGVPLAQQGNTENPFTFGGRHGVMQEAASGLYYMRSRYYDATTAHFLTRDPARRSESPAETNVYSFARANPLMFEDPSGQNAVIEGDISGIGSHTEITVDVWENGKVIGTLNASFGEGEYRRRKARKEDGMNGGVLWRGQGTIVLNFQPGAAVTQNAGENNTFVSGGQEQDERAAEAILTAVDFAASDLPQYQAGTPAGSFLRARRKEIKTEDGKLASHFGGMFKGSGIWATYGVIMPGRTCNTFTGTILNAFFGHNDRPVGITASSVGENLKANLDPNWTPPERDYMALMYP